MNSLFDNKEAKRELIKTVRIEPTQFMPLDLYKQLHRVAYFMECMERVSANQVVWDETVEELYCEESAEAEYIAFHKGFLKAPVFELPETLTQKLFGICS